MKVVQKTIKIYRRHDIDLLALHTSNVQMGRVIKGCLKAAVTREPYVVHVPDELQLDGGDGDVPKSITVKIKLNPDNNVDRQIIDLLDSVPSGLCNGFCKMLVRTYMDRPLAVFGADVKVPHTDAGDGKENKKEKETEKETVQSEAHVQEEAPVSGESDGRTDSEPETVVPEEDKESESVSGGTMDVKAFMADMGTVAHSSPVESEPVEEDVMGDMMSLFGTLAHSK